MPGWPIVDGPIILPPGWTWREDAGSLYLCEGERVAAAFPAGVGLGDLFRTVLEEIQRARGPVVVLPISTN